MAEKLSGNIKMLSLDIENETEPNSIIKCLIVILKI